MKRDVSFDLLHGLMNVSVKNGHRPELFQVGKRLRAILGSPSPLGVYESVWQLGLTLPLYFGERRSTGWPIFWSTTRSKLTCCHQR
jgi:hypothetical protein